MTKESVAQGQGKDTEFKERGLQLAFTINMKVFNGLKKNTDMALLGDTSIWI